jgi:hypothetical protein
VAFLDEKIAIVGVGATDFATMYKERDPSRTSYGLGIDALDDAGLEIGAIDGLPCSRMPSYERIGDLLSLCLGSSCTKSTLRASRRRRPMWWPSSNSRRGRA